MAKKKQAKRRQASRRTQKQATSLPALRRALDKLDRECLALIQRRAEVAGELASRNPNARQETDQDRIQRLIADTSGPLDEAALRSVYRELLSGCRQMQSPIRVAFLGPEYTFSHLAAIHRFGRGVAMLPVANIAAVFHEVERGQATYGIAPIENSTDGRISDTLEMLTRSEVRICGELPLRIHHNLLGRGPRSQVRTVYSKPQALSQCRKWLADHLPGAEIVETPSTTEAARIARERSATAAVASLEAAVAYELDVLAKNIEDNSGNVTRFAIFGQAAAERSGDDKTALVFELPHKPGALADAMNIFKRKELNLNWIESFPIPETPGSYSFFVELVGHQVDLRVRRAIDLLAKKASRLVVLGSYPRVEPVG